MPKVSVASVSADSLSPGKQAGTCEHVTKPEGKRGVRWRTFLCASRKAVGDFLGLDTIFIQILAFLMSRVISIAKTKLKKVKKEKWQYNAKIVQFYSNIL